MAASFDPNILSEVDDVAHLSSPIALARQLNPQFRVRPQQTVISNAYMDAITGRGPRFIGISIPQQFGKTEISSIHAPMHFMELHALGIMPGGLVGLMSYEDALPMTWSTRIRRTMAANEELFFSTLRKDSKAAGFWQTEQDSGILAIGVGGSLQGRPLSFVGVDDPTKSLEMALSPLHQNRIWDHWTSVIYGRLQPWSIVLVTMARLAPDDFMGRLKSNDYEGDPSDWRFIEIPYICDSAEDPLGREIGEPMIRPQADQTIEQALEEAENIKKSVSTYSWNCTPGESPLLMGDFTTRPIREVKEGETVVGFKVEPGKKLKLVASRVVETMSKEETVWEYHMESGRVIRATEDHRWFVRRERDYQTAKVGTPLRFIMEPSDEAEEDERGWWQYFAGIIDGEGSIDGRLDRRSNHLTIAQTRGKNEPVADRILEAMDRLGISYTKRMVTRKDPKWEPCEVVYIRNAATVHRKLLRLTHFAKRNQSVQALYSGAGRNDRFKDRVIWIGNPKREKVYALTTETGNYVVWGYASSNSLWQQAPSDPNDAIFPESKWRYYGGDSEYLLPDEFDQVIMSWDMAFKDESYHDFVVGQAWGAKGEDRYLLDQVRGHWGFTETCSRVKLFAERIRRKYPKARVILVEDKANGTAVIDSLRSIVGGLLPVTPLESKLSRAWAVQPVLLGGNMYLPAPSQFPWVTAFSREWADFRGTGAGHDDQVDAGVQACRWLMDHKGMPVHVRTSTVRTQGPPRRHLTAPRTIRRFR